MSVAVAVSIILGATATEDRYYRVHKDRRLKPTITSSDVVTIAIQVVILCRRTMGMAIDLPGLVVVAHGFQPRHLRKDNRGLALCKNFFDEPLRD